MRAAGLLLLAACTGAPSEPAPAAGAPAAALPAADAPAADAPDADADADAVGDGAATAPTLPPWERLPFAAVPTQQLSADRLSAYRNPVATGAPEHARFNDATECVQTPAGRACIIAVPGHETIAIGPPTGETGPLLTLGSSGAFSVVALNASGRHLAYGLRYDKLPGTPVKLFVVDMPRMRDPQGPVDAAVRVLTRGVLGPPGPPTGPLRDAILAEHNPQDGQRAAFCQIPVRARTAAPEPRVRSYHFPCHLPATTAPGTHRLALSDDGFGPTDLRVLAVVAPPAPPAGG